MCGIWGVVGVGDESIAEIAARAMEHRGPDDYGIYVTRDGVPVSLVNRRLAIIDLSPAGHQPMTNEDGRYWIVYNGEIFNFAVIREELLGLGHDFKSHSDTEVVLHAYEQWGTACVERFRGMFAIAIWDTLEKRLFAARDRLGIKPVYYTLGRNAEGERTLAFASELKALLATGLASAELNYPAVHHYLAFYSVPTPYSMLKDVEALPPGHYMIFENGKLSIQQYWSIPAIEPVSMSEGEIKEELRRLLEESIRLRMIADVPVGAFLSGGVDSSAVVALMTRISGNKLKTFSVGFGAEGQRMDERSEARLMAQHYNTDHTEVIIGGSDVAAQIDSIICGMDQPSGDGLNTYFVSQAARKEVTVALSGLGGDELFAGYPQFKMFQQAERATDFWNKLPAMAQGAARSTAAVLDPVKRMITWVDGDVLAKYERVRVLFDEEAKMRLYTPSTVKAMGAPEASLETLARYVHPAEIEPIAQVTRLELSGYMAHTLLRDADAMSMAHSLEVRVPLIDHKLVEFAVRIPPELKLRNGRTKWIFGEAIKDVVPAEVLNRPKRGFEMPVGSWMKNEMREIVADALSHRSVAQRGLFKPEAVQAIYDDFLQGNSSYMKTWSLVVLELWMRRFIDGRAL